MTPTTYYSADTDKILSLAEATYREFAKFLSRYQWALDDPSHSPRGCEIASAIKNKGTPGGSTFLRSEGYKITVRTLLPWVFEKAISQRRKLYFVSYGKFALIYFDIDLHYAWQTKQDGERAKRLIDDHLAKFFGENVVFWWDSSRGFNGYLKVDLQGMEYGAANRVFERLEKAIERLLAEEGILADFEIKGRIGFCRDDKYSWGQYGKLPIHDSAWSFESLTAFSRMPSVLPRALEIISERIEDKVPAAILERHTAYKRSLGDAPLVRGGYFLVTPAIEKRLVEKFGEAWHCHFSMAREHVDETIWLPVCHLDADGGIIGDRELADQTTKVQADTPAAPQSAAKSSQPRSPAPTRKKRPSPATAHLDVSDLESEPNSYERQCEALLRLARHCKRVPTVEEALQFIHGRKLFTGTWEENAARREARVASILTVIAKDFDPSKCRGGSVNVEKFSQWAAKKFPNGIFSNPKKYVTPDGDIGQYKALHVKPEFIAVFMAICEFCLIHKPEENDAMPYERYARLWKALYDSGATKVKFCDRKWAVCREAMHRMGIVLVTQRSYCHGQARKYAVGDYFPLLGRWKKPKQPSLLGSISLADFLQRIGTTTNNVPNTLSYSRCPNLAVPGLLQPSRPPP